MRIATIAALGLLSAVATANASVVITNGPLNYFFPFNTPNTTTTGPTVSSTDLINGTLPTLSSGSFGQEGTGGAVPLATLTDGSGGALNSASAWTGVSSGSSLTYTLNLVASPSGYDLSSIDAYTGWGDNGRSQPHVTVSYALVGSPTTFVSLGTNTEPSYPFGAGGVWGSVNFADTTGTLASGVAAVRFDFPSQQSGYVGYRELDVTGTPTATPEPAMLGVLGIGGLVALRRRRA